MLNTGMKETLGEFARRRREELGLVQAEVAAKMEVEPKTIANLEVGRTKTLKGRNLRALAKALDVPFEVVQKLSRKSRQTKMVRIPVDAYEAIADAAERKGWTVEEYLVRLADQASSILRVDEQEIPAAQGQLRQSE